VWATVADGPTEQIAGWAHIPAPWIDSKSEVTSPPQVLAATSSNTERQHPELDELILGGSDPGQTSWSQPLSGSTAQLGTSGHGSSSTCGNTTSHHWAPRVITGQVFLLICGFGVQVPGGARPLTLPLHFLATWMRLFRKLRSGKCVQVRSTVCRHRPNADKSAGVSRIELSAATQSAESVRPPSTNLRPVILRSLGVGPGLRGRGG